MRNKRPTRFNTFQAQVRKQPSSFRPQKRPSSSGGGGGAMTAPWKRASLHTLKIGPPPRDGIYFGAYEWTAGDIASVEAAAQISCSHYHSGYGNWALQYSSGHPHLNLAAANAAWDAGKAIVVQAYNLYAGTDTEHPAGFTVDKLLAGDYDSNLATFAAELRAFGKPCWFQCGREPNGVGQDYMGGFGTDGTQSLSWAITNENAYNQFTPPSVPSGAPATLYDGCSGATMPDGIGRLKAGQRYLHDFFERRENLHFLTWDSQGFTARYYRDAVDNQEVYDSADYVGHESYALTLLQRASDPAYWYPGDAYCDWVSLTWYYLDYYDAGWSWLTGSDILIPNTEWVSSLSNMMTKVAAVTSKPVMLAEFGMPDGLDSDTAYGATKITSGFTTVLTSWSQIKAVSLWSNHESWLQVDIFPYDCLLRPNTTQATALQAVIAAHPTKFHSYVTLSDGLPHPRVL